MGGAVNLCAYSHLYLACWPYRQCFAGGDADTGYVADVYPQAGGDDIGADGVWFLDVAQAFDFCA